jgi:hypothetical protein
MPRQISLKTSRTCRCDSELRKQCMLHSSRPLAALLLPTSLCAAAVQHTCAAHTFECSMQRHRRLTCVAYATSCATPAPKLCPATDTAVTLPSTAWRYSAARSPLRHSVLAMAVKPLWVAPGKAIEAVLFSLYVKSAGHWQQQAASTCSSMMNVHGSTSSGRLACFCWQL